jgi:hypothetical protein
MGRDLRELAFANDPELNWTRRVLVRYGIPSKLMVMLDVILSFISAIPLLAYGIQYLSSYGCL